MLKPSKKIEYSLMALKFMSGRERGKLTSAREICERFKTPFDTTAKVMQVLNNAKILQSVKGVKGGYTLVKDLSGLSYYELTVLIEGPSFENHCLKDKEQCSRIGICNISKSMTLLDKQIGDFLKKISVQDIITEQFFVDYVTENNLKVTHNCHNTEITDTKNDKSHETEDKGLV